MNTSFALSKYKYGVNKIIFIFTALCLLVFFFIIPGNITEYITGDYRPQVNTLLNGNYFLDDHHHLLDRYPPLTSFVFFIITKVAFFFNLNPIYFYVVFIIIMLSISNVLLYHIASIFKIKAVGFITSILFATCPFIGILPLELISEPMFIFFTFLSIYLLINEYKSNKNNLYQFIKIGIVLGLCMLSRPTGLLFVLFFSFFIFILYDNTIYMKICYSLIILFTSIIVILPWEYSVYKYNHYIVPLSSGGVPSSRDGLSFNNKLYRQKIALPPDVNDLLNRFFNNYSKYDNTIKIYIFMMQEFTKSPVTVFKLYFIKALRCWYGTDSQNHKKELLNKMVVSIYIILSFIGLYKPFKDKRDRNIEIFFVLFILLNWFTAIMVLSILRYLVPIIGILFIFSAIGIWKILKYIKLLKE